MSPVGGRRGAVFRVLCIFHNALLCSSVVRLKEAMDQDMNQDAGITSIFKFSVFFDFVVLKIFQNNY